MCNKPNGFGQPKKTKQDKLNELYKQWDADLSQELSDREIEEYGKMFQKKIREILAK